MSAHIYFRTITIAAILACSSAIQSNAEDEFGNSDAAVQQNCLCFRGAPLDRCRSFLLFEFGIRYYTEKYLGESERGGGVTAEFGWMKNINNNFALGVAAYQTADLRTYRFAVRPHIRHWFSRELNLDFAPGVILYCQDADIHLFTDHPRYDADGPGIAASLTLSAFDLLAVTAQYERFNVTHYPSSWIAPSALTQAESYTANQFSFGITGQSYVGVPFAALAIILDVVALVN